MWERPAVLTWLRWFSFLMSYTHEGVVWKFSMSAEHCIRSRAKGPIFPYEVKFVLQSFTKTLIMLKNWALVCNPVPISRSMDLAGRRRSPALISPSSFILKESRVLGQTHPMLLPRLRGSPLPSGWLMNILVLLSDIKILVFPSRENSFPHWVRFLPQCFMKIRSSKFCLPSLHRLL